MKNDNQMTDAEYHAHPALNYSRIKHLRESAKHFRHACDNPKTSSSSMVFGSLVHLLVFECEKFDERYVVTDATDKRTKAYKEAKKAADETGRDLVTEAELEAANQAARNVTSHPWVAELLADKRTEVETAHFWTQPGFGEVRMKVDAARLSPDGLHGVDLKTTRSTHPLSFRRDARMFGYEVQCAHYLHGLADRYGVELGNVAVHWSIIAVENVAPFDVTVFHFSVDTIDKALCEYDALAELYEICVETNTWPGRAEEADLDLTWSK